MICDALISQKTELLGKVIPICGDASASDG